MAFSGTPVQPVIGLVMKSQATAERFQLLPFPAGYSTAQAWAAGGYRARTQTLGLTELFCATGESRKRLWCREEMRLVVGGFSLLQTSVTQPERQLRVLRLPVKLQMGLGCRSPELLMIEQELIQGFESGEQLLGISEIGFWHVSQSVRLTGPGRHPPAGTAPAA